MYVQRFQQYQKLIALQIFNRTLLRISLRRVRYKNKSTKDKRQYYFAWSLMVERPKKNTENILFKRLYLRLNLSKLYSMFQYCSLCDRKQVQIGSLPFLCPFHQSQEEFQGHFSPQIYQEIACNQRSTVFEKRNLPQESIPLNKNDQKEDQSIKLIKQALKKPIDQLDQDHPKNGQNGRLPVSEELIAVQKAVPPTNHSNLKQPEQALKKQKNQYDKNIPGNVVLTVLSQLVTGKYSKEIHYYCDNLQTKFKKVMLFARQSQEDRKKIGTSWIGKCFRGENAQNKIHRVFALFMIRFLREQYHLYILNAGKMRKRQKYLECARNIMYIPRLQKYQYELISRFQRTQM